jgi:carboxymethylenebutenolidase
MFLAAKFLVCSAALVALLILPASILAQVTEEKATLKSGDKDIRIERFEPKGKGPFPAVVMLNGSNGVEANHTAYRDFGLKLAEAGYVALLPFYFDRTDTTYADKDTIYDNYIPWMLTIDDTIKYAHTLDKVDRKRVGMVGFSLGSFLALSLAATRGNDRITAVAEYAGGYPLDNPVHKLLGDVKKMPPVLILHGEKDDIVPVKEARSLESLLRENKITYEINVYDNQKHLFTGDDARDASDRVVRFFDKHLKKTETEK